MRASHLEHWVVRPTLHKMAAFDDRLSSESAVQLLLGTAAQESDLFYNLVQLGHGPGKGGFSIETATHHSIWEHYLNRPEKQYLREIILGMVPDSSVINDDSGKTFVADNELVTNMIYTTAIARLVYWPVSQPLPDHDDLEALAGYYKKHFNTEKGAATTKQFIEKYNRLVAGK